MAIPVGNPYLPLTGDIRIDGLVQGSRWDFGGGPRELGYSFHEITAFEPVEVWVDVGPRAVEIAGITDALMQWSNVANITFVKREGQPLDGDKSIAELAFTLGGEILEPDGASGFAYYPDPRLANIILDEDFDDGTGTGTDEDRTTWPQPEGDIAIDLNGVGPFEPGAFGYHVAVHEVGHALGMKHPHDDGANGRPILSGAFNSWMWTVMSYGAHPLSGEFEGNVATPMPLDILAIQHIYGANMSYHTGDDTYLLADDGIIKTIWDAGGVDTMSREGFSSNTTISLQPGTHTTHGARSVTAIAFNVTIENAIGGSGNDTITGNGAANRIDGRAGADTMFGLGGDDTYLVDNTGDTVNEASGAGVDTVLSTATFTLSANVENLTLEGTAGIGGTGNALDNVLTGNAGANELNGGLGNDRLEGGLATDTLRGGGGNDTYLIGGAETDAVIENAGEGTDTVQSSIGYGLGDNVENLVLTGSGDIDGTGNALANTLTGNSGNNLLDGGAGNDTMIGGDGNDTYDVDSALDVVNETGTGGDTVIARINYTLGANLENLTLAGSAVSGTGNGLANTILGNALSNVLDGMAGADAMTGGLGSDTYIVDDAGDTVNETGGDGLDSVRSSVSFLLTDGVENLALTGAGNINGTGNNIANVLRGNAGANTLSGMGGDDTYFAGTEDTIEEQAGGGIDTVFAGTNVTLADHLENLILFGAATGGAGNSAANTLTANALASTLTGGGGNDTYVLRGQGDVVIEASGGGNDTVVTRSSYVLGESNVENVELTGLAAANATGNADANVLSGNAGANVLDGQGGADTMTGGGGDDTYFVDDELDQVIEAASGGMDRVFSSVSYALPGNVEGLTLTGMGNVNGTGNELNNSLTGNAGNNRLDGGAGRDVMAGGAGNDTYVMDPGDRVIEASGEGTDTVETASSYTLAADLENLTLTGMSDAQGTGNDLDNVINGNGGANVLDGGFGADRLDGGGGNDVLVFDMRDDLVAGGAGTDLLRFSGRNQHLDLTQVGEDVYTGIEAIDLTGRGRNTLTLTADDVLALSDNDVLIVDGDGASRVISTGQGWELEGTSGGYREYSASSGATLLVDTEILLTLS